MQTYMNPLHITISPEKHNLVHYYTGVSGQLVFALDNHSNVIPRVQIRCIGQPSLVQDILRLHYWGRIGTLTA